MELRDQPLRKHGSHQYLVADLHNLGEDGEGQAEKNVADQSPAEAKVLVDWDGRDVARPRGFIHVH